MIHDVATDAPPSFATPTDALEFLAYRQQFGPGADVPLVLDKEWDIVGDYPYHVTTGMRRPPTDIGATHSFARALLADYLKVRKDVLATSSPKSETIRGVPPLAGAAAVAARNGVNGIVFVGAWGDDAPAGRRIVFGDMAVFRIFFGKGTACADLSAIDRTGTVIYYGRESGDSCSLTEHDGVHKIFGDLVAGLPPAGGKRGD
jgi:hypothetical protein